MSLKFTKATDSEHTIKLEPRLVSASWVSSRAFAGGKASLEVITEFVGQRAPIQITVKKEGGGNIEKISSVIRNNCFIQLVAIPGDIDLNDKVYFEVKLPKNGLDGESNRIPAAPAIRVMNMSWNAQEAQREDILTLSADISGLREGSDVTVTIFEHDQDQAHDKIVEIPTVVKDSRMELKWEYEYHEDTDEIPSQEELDKYGGKYNPPEYFFTMKHESNEFGLEQESGLLMFKDWIEISVRDSEGVLLAGRKLKIIRPDGSECDGALDSEGKFRATGLSPGSCRVQIMPTEEGE